MSTHSAESRFESDNLIITYLFEDDHGSLSDLTPEERERDRKEKDKSFFERIIDEAKKVLH